MDTDQKYTGSAASTVEPIGTAVRAPRLRLPRQAVGYLFIMPAMIFLLLVVAYPLFTTLRMSFEQLVVRQKTVTFVGLQNYNDVLKDPVFWSSMKNTVVYVIGSMTLHLLVGGFFAFLLNEKWAAAPIRNFARGLLILPWLFSMAAAALMWA